MATNTTSKKSAGFDDITPSLGNNAVALLSVRKNSQAILNQLKYGRSFGPERFSGERQQTIQELERLIPLADASAGELSRCVNVWNTVGGDETTPDDLMLDDDDMVRTTGGRPSVQEILQLFNKTKSLDDMSDQLNSKVIVDPSSEESISALKDKLHAACMEVRAAEQVVVQAKAMFKAQGKGQIEDDPTILAAESRHRLAFMAQIAAYNKVTAAKLSSAVARDRPAEDLFWPDWSSIGSFIKGAAGMVAKGAQVAQNVASIFG